MAQPSSPCVRALSIITEAVLIGSLTLFWVQLLVRAWLNSASKPPLDSTAASALDTAAAVLDVEIVDIDSFLQLSLTLFDGREKWENSPQLLDESRWTEADESLDSVQVARVPGQASRRYLSNVARRLVGCAIIDNGSECRLPGNPPGGCPDESLPCPKVIGLLEHVVDGEILADGAVISLSQLRSPVERLVSSFFAGDKPHFPLCAHRKGKTKQDVHECFTTIVQTHSFRNVAGRAYTGLDAPDAHVDADRRAADDAKLGHSGGDGGDSDEGDGDHEDGGDAAAGDAVRGFQDTLSSSALGRLCLFNHIALWEAPGTSALLLLETLPWIRPDRSFFKGFSPPADSSEYEQGGGVQGLQGIRFGESIYGDDASWRLQFITQDLLDIVSAANQVDEKLYDVVAAKMCSRLSELGLLEHLAVQAELAASPLGKRCGSREWYEAVIDSVDGAIGTHPQGERIPCRLFQPVHRPPWSV